MTFFFRFISGRMQEYATLKDFSSILSIAYPSSKLNPQLYPLYKALNYESC